MERGAEKTVRVLTPEDLPGIRDLVGRCGDYYDLVEGISAEEAVREVGTIFEDLPPGKRPEDKVLLGLFVGTSGGPVALADVLRDYPEPGIWVVGLLLVDGTRRREGLGGELHRAVASRAREGGARTLRIGVLAQNEGARRFWERLGYRETERREGYRIGRREGLLLVSHRPVEVGA